jgi:LmbE family N-acetylglucosaminyl deacetylase
MVTTRVDATAHWQTVLQAVYCHRSQLNGLGEALRRMPAEVHRRLWGNQCLYRAYSLVNGGRQVEEDLFAGLR